MHRDDSPGSTQDQRRTRPGPSGPSWRLGRTAPLAACACIGLLAAACSGSPAHPAAGSGNAVDSALAYSHCMRSHGITNFPDPNAQGGFSMSSGDGIDQNSAQFKAAQNACQSKMGGGHLSPAKQREMQARLRKFAGCMRTHGVPGYPDPVFGPGGMVRQKISKSSGVDPTSPQYQAAQKTCQQLAEFGPGGSGGSGW